MTAVTGLREAIARGFAAGLAGTTAMSASLAVEQRLLPHAPQPIDYDASPHVVTAASTILRWRPNTDARRTALFLVVHWGYGSAVGVAYDALRRVTGNSRLAGVLFYAGCQAMAMSLFPLAGGTPPPWRWRRLPLVSSLLNHALYAAVVAQVDDALARRSAAVAAS